MIKKYNKKNFYIAPSLFAIDNKKKNNEIINEISNLNIKYFHFDVMDKKFIGHYALTFNDLKKINNIVNIIEKIDVHLMVNNPYKYAKKFISLGIKFITFHYEAFNCEEKCLQCINKIRQLGAKIGIAIKPKTPLKKILFLLNKIDLILIMSVEPGLSGQKFITNSLKKIHECHNFIVKKKLNVLISVDGGINEMTGFKCLNNGANILVVGSYLFKEKNIKKKYKYLINFLKKH